MVKVTSGETMLEREKRGVGYSHSGWCCIANVKKCVEKSQPLLLSSGAHNVNVSISLSETGYWSRGSREAKL
jgi:hypothetical protein